LSTTRNAEFSSLVYTRLIFLHFDFYRAVSRLAYAALIQRLII